MRNSRNVRSLAVLVSALTVGLTQVAPVHAADATPKAEEKANPCAGGGSARRRASSSGNPCAGNPCAGNSRRKRGDDANPCAGARR